MWFILTKPKARSVEPQNLNDRSSGSILVEYHIVTRIHNTYYSLLMSHYLAITMFVCSFTQFYHIEFLMNRKNNFPRQCHLNYMQVVLYTTLLRGQLAQRQTSFSFHTFIVYIYICVCYWDHSWHPRVSKAMCGTHTTEKSIEG